MDSKKTLPVERIMGWKCFAFPKKEAELIEKGKEFEIFELNGEFVFSVKMPVLTVQEAFLLRKIIKKFQSLNSKKDFSDLNCFLENYCLENSIALEKEQFGYFLKILNSSIFGFSALDFFLPEQIIEEIAIIGIGIEKPVFVFHKKFGWLKTNVFFGSNKHVKNLANKMARKIGRRLTLECPKLNANLPDGSRLTATIAPISRSTSITIRKFLAEPFTPIDLIENNTFSLDFCAFAWLALELECSFLIAGNTGSGKTSSLNCLFAFVPKQERIIVVEETPEIVLPHEHQVKLGVVKEQGFGMPSLIVDTLRMRPDRVVVGEMRNKEEALAFMDTLLAGQGKGSYATFHAQSTKEAIARLKSFGISELDLTAIDLLIIQRRWAEPKNKNCVEKRRIVEASEIVFNENSLELNPVFEFDFQKDSLKRIGESKKVFEKARDFLGVDRKGFALELQKRKNFLEKSLGKKLSLREFFEKVQGIKNGVLDIK